MYCKVDGVPACLVRAKPALHSIQAPQNKYVADSPAVVGQEECITFTQRLADRAASSCCSVNLGLFAIVT